MDERGALVEVELKGIKKEKVKEYIDGSLSDKILR